MSRWVHDGIRAVFFDAVGTLLFPDPPAPEIYAAVARKHGLAMEPDTVRQRFLMAFDLEEAADRDRGWVTSENREVERWARIVAQTLPGVPEAGFAELYRHFASPDAWRVDPAASDLLRKLDSLGLALGMASNYDSRLWPVLDGCPALAPLRERVVISAAVGYRKPARQFFDAVTDAARCAAAAILLVGDDPVNDYDGATAAGLEAVLLDDSGHHADVPRRIRSLVELL